jgi:hypothetical protein
LKIGAEPGKISHNLKKMALGFGLLEVQPIQLSAPLLIELL